VEQILSGEEGEREQEQKWKGGRHGHGSESYGDLSVRKSDGGAALWGRNGLLMRVQVLEERAKSGERECSNKFTGRESERIPAFSSHILSVHLVPVHGGKGRAEKR